MSELVVIGFGSEGKADEVLLELYRMHAERLLSLEDTAVAIKSPDGRLQVKPGRDLMISGGVSGGFWGLLLGAIFLSPLAGLAAGAAGGALAGALIDVGLDEGFIRDLGATLAPGTSALFLLLRGPEPERALAGLGELVDLRGCRAAVLRSSLSHADEARLQAALTPVLLEQRVRTLHDFSDEPGFSPPAAGAPSPVSATESAASAVVPSPPAISTAKTL